jgi:prepilin-type N-terminal cleavage/methylation domain-containing protein
MIPRLVMTAFLLTALLLTAEMPTCIGRRKSGILPPRNAADGVKPMSRGFTLVELLVVIGIIALLIGILIPTLGKARAAANRAACLSNIRQLGIGIVAYCNANKGCFPTCANPADGLSWIQYPDDWIYWQANRNLDDSQIARLLNCRGERLKALLRCPADHFDSFDEGRTIPGISSGQGPYLYSYSMHGRLGANMKPYPGGANRTKITQWRSPWRKIMLTEGAENYAARLYRSAAWEYDEVLARRHGSYALRGNIAGDPLLTRGAKVGKNVSTVFIDGHAEGIDTDFGLDWTQGVPEAP